VTVARGLEAQGSGAGAPVLALPEGARLVVVSPHLDDAALSCGELLSRPGRAATAVVLTLFTECSAPRTLSASAYLRQCGVPADRAGQLYADRRGEDSAALDGLGVRWEHAGLEDALFRKREDASPGWRAAAGRLLPELLHVYPTYRWHVARGRVSPRDTGVLARVASLLDAEVDRERAHGPVVLVAPLGVGGHVDHVLARDAAREAGRRAGAPVLHYADVPYSLQAAPDPAFTARHALRQVPLGGSGRAKQELVRQYATQAAALFPGGVPQVDDVYYAPAELLAAGADAAVGTP
jgi:LmbE family N-acetylglucosaminyl deacetylase